jgi:alpha-D-xyloside xylohydrolase
MYAIVHNSLRDYSYKYAEEAHKTGMPIVRPLFLVDPSHRESWENWWTYLYGPDLLVSPVWEKGKRKQDVYLPAGNRWRDAWNPDKVYTGGQTISVSAETHQLPLFIRVGSSLKPWNLNQLWISSVDIARKKPDLRLLEATVTAWYQQNAGK